MSIKFENNELYRGDNVVIDDIQSKCETLTPYEICMNEGSLNGVEKVDCLSTLACPSSEDTVGDELSTRHALLSKACDFKQDDISELTKIYTTDEEFKNKLDVVGDVNLGDATVNCGNQVLQKIYNDFETHCDDSENKCCNNAIAIADNTRTHNIEDLEKLGCSLTPPHRIEIHNEDGTTSYKIEKDKDGLDMTDTAGNPIYIMGLTPDEENKYAECVGKLKTEMCPFIPTNHRFEVQSAMKEYDNTCQISDVNTADDIINRVCSSVSSDNWIQECAASINNNPTEKAAFCRVSTPQVSYDINEVNEILNSDDDDYQCMQGSKAQTIDATEYTSECNDTDTSRMCASTIWTNSNFCTNTNPNNEQSLATCDGLYGIESLCCHSNTKINLISGVRKMCDMKNSMCRSNNADNSICNNEQIDNTCRFYNEKNYTSLLNVCNQ